MAYPSVTYSNFVNGTTSDADQIDTNFADIIAALSDGSKDLNINGITVNGSATFNGTISINPTILRLPNGTAAAPSYSFTNDTDCGLYRVSANDIALSVNGANVLEMSTTQVTVTGDFLFSGNYAGTFKVQGDASFNLGSTTNRFSTLFAVAIDSQGSSLDFKTTAGTVGTITSAGAFTIGISSAHAHVLNGASLTANPGAGNTFNYQINGSTSVVRFQAGSAGGTDPRIDIYGSSHASRASQFEFYQGSTQVFDIDSTGIFTIGSSGFTSTHIVNGALSVTESFKTTKTVSIGGIPGTGVGFRVADALSLSGTTQYGILSSTIMSSSATSEILTIASQVQTQNASFTCSLASAFNAVTASKGAASTITRLVNFYSSTQTAGTNNAAIADNFAFSGNYFIHSTGTAPSFLTGAIATARADVASTATITAMSSTNSFVRITGSTITSIQGITAGIDGQRLTVFNNAGVAVTFAHENAGASAANRITTMTGADVSTTGNGAAELIYDTGTSRWILLFVTA